MMAETIMTEKPAYKKPVCPSCGSLGTITDYKHGETLCKNCGLVLNDTLFDFGPETRAFDEEQRQKRARTGPPLKYAKLGKGLTTEIDRYDRDIKGGPIPPERKSKFYRLRRWQTRSKMGTSTARNLSTALPMLDKMCGHLKIPNNIKEECAKLYREAQGKGIVRGRSIESVIAAVIYLVSRQHRLPKTLEELKQASGVKIKEIGRSYRTICKRLGIKMPVTMAVDYISKLASEAGISGETEAKAIEILENARESGVIAGRVQISVAAAAIYLAARITGDKHAQKIKSIGGIPESGIKSRYAELEKSINGNDKEVLLEDIDTEVSPEPETLDHMMWKLKKKQILLEFADELNLSDEIREKAIEILEKVMEKNIMKEADANAYIGAAIYLSVKNTDEKISLWKIEMAVKASSTTIWDRKERVKKALIETEQ